MAAVAALGFALSACGGGGGTSSATSPAAQSSTSSGSSTATDSPAPDPSTSTGTSTATGSGSSGTSGSTGSNPPTASIGNVTINWNAPTENTDGSALTDLAGFKIHYGTASGKYTQTITVGNPGLATYVVTNLAAGKYYFAVTAYSSAGTESTPSAEVSTTVN